MIRLAVEEPLIQQSLKAKGASACESFCALIYVAHSWFLSVVSL